VANRDKLIPLIRQYQEELRQITAMLEKNDSQQLFDTFTNAKNARQRFLDQFEH
jgi:prephenate dehydrogenase